jgi:hypothetical protein
MITRLDVLAGRRAALVEEIGVERERMAQALDSLRTQAALAGVGMLATRVLGRTRWFRWLAAAAAVASIALPLAARQFAGRR